MCGCGRMKSLTMSRMMSGTVVAAGNGRGWHGGIGTGFWPSHGQMASIPDGGIWIVNRHGSHFIMSDAGIDRLPCLWYNMGDGSRVGNVYGTHPAGPSKESTMKCPHRKYQDEHCAEMECWNYFSKCPRHANQDSNAECTHIVLP